MQIYLVGGAVRDTLLGRHVKDRDYVVVGATEQSMLDKGFAKVGADFPVFLHPITGEEFALARKERKVSAGYKGFEVDFDPSVTLEEDLIRRDLTINAMAVPVDEDLNPNWDHLVDPFNGQQDLKEGILRHVSEAFAEDPVRILRVARFAARYGFDVAKDTVVLMSDLVSNGELNHLVPERVWSELERALTEPFPKSFFWTLRKCCANQVLFPELKIDNFLESSLTDSPENAEIRFALMCINLEETAINGLCMRLKVPNNFRRIALNARQMCELLRKEKMTSRDVVCVLDMVKKDAQLALDIANYSAYNNEQFRKNVVRVLLISLHVQKVRFADLTLIQQKTLRGSEISYALHELRLKIADKYLHAI